MVIFISLQQIQGDHNEPLTSVKIFMPKTYLLKWASLTMTMIFLELNKRRNMTNALVQTNISARELLETFLFNNSQASSVFKST